MTTPDPKVDVEGMRKVAEAATRGRWTANLHHTQVSAGRTYGFIHASAAVPLAAVTLGVEGMSEDEGRANAAHIATFDPPTVLAMLARIEELEEALDAARAEGLSLLESKGISSVANGAAAGPSDCAATASSCQSEGGQP
jgi:hypothetical protein